MEEKPALSGVGQVLLGLLLGILPTVVSLTISFSFQWFGGLFLLFASNVIMLFYGLNKLKSKTYSTMANCIVFTIVAQLLLILVVGACFSWFYNA